MLSKREGMGDAKQQGWDSRGSSGRKSWWIAPLLLLSILLLPGSSPAATDKTASPAVRKPAVAGSFYSSDRAVLEKTIDGYLKNADAKAPKVRSQIFGLMAPHAGYEYSGGVAGLAFNQLKGRAYATVVIVGSSHRVPFKGISIYPSGSWETPLGKVEIDEQAGRILMERCKAIRPSPQAFEQEHSLEVEVPFLQKTLKGFRIVPLLIGSMEPDDYHNLANAFLGLYDQNPGGTLIVASSDMSHYHPYETAKRMDAATLKAMEAQDLDKLITGLQKGDGELCGAHGVIALMLAARRMGADATVLGYANSGDVTSDRNRVVGYGAVLFSLPSEDFSLNDTEKKALLAMARKTVDEYVQKGSVPQFEVKEKKLLEKRGAFVTLTKKGSLRGCVGYTSPVFPLHRVVTEMAVAASTRDGRFAPVKKDELKDIHIEISVLSPLKPVGKIEEIEVGKHGLVIIRGDRSGLLLPQVASDYKWNREEFLQQTCRKAGLPPGAWKEKETRIQSFTAQVFGE